MTTPPTARAPGVTDAGLSISDIAQIEREYGIALKQHPEATTMWRYYQTRLALCRMARAALAHPPAAEREAPGGVVPEGWPDASVFLDCAMKPEEIMGVEREARIAELLRWFARYKDGQASPKWIYEHMFELCLFIITERQRAAAPSPPAAGQSGGDGTREREKALREAAEIASRMEIAWAQSGQQFNEAGMIPAGDARRSYAYAAREVQREILALLAAPAEGGRDG